MNPADCHTRQRVLYSGRAYIVSALAGANAILADGAEFRTVPIAELESLLTNSKLEDAIRDIGKEASPTPDWQQSVSRRIGAGEAKRRPRVALALAVAAIVTILIAWWLAS